MTTPPTYYITTPQERPDYRTVKAFLWGEERNCDGDGNAEHPASRTWTQLMLAPRDVQGVRFDLSEHSFEPLVLKVHASEQALAARVAYIVAFATEGAVARRPQGPYSPPQQIIAELGDFDLDAAMERFRTSRFVRATRNNPYPEA